MLPGLVSWVFLDKELCGLNLIFRHCHMSQDLSLIQTAIDVLCAFFFKLA